MDPYSKSPQTIYFAYGSNLSTTQMSARCPSSTCLGIGLLRGWKWIITARGYANVVELPKETQPATTSEGTANPDLPAAIAPHSTQSSELFAATTSEDFTIVYGLVYSLPPVDEASLDGYEGVPWAYTKEVHGIEFWPRGEGEGEVPSVGAEKPGNGQIVKALVYVDRKRVEPAAPKAEYVGRMGRGVKESKEWGIPGEWLERVVGGFVDLKDE